MADPTFLTLKYAVQDSIAEIVLDRPPLNLIDEISTLEYHSALRAADADPDVRVIILRGAGKGLSAGVDLHFLDQFDAAAMEKFLRLLYVDTLTIVRNLGKPIIAAVHGYAREGACTLAFACDMIVAADDASFAYPGVSNLAGPPGMHVWYLQRLIGRMRAAELVFTGEPIDAQTACALGMITKVVPADSLLDATRGLAGKLVKMSPLALHRTRKLFFEMEDADFREVPEMALLALAAAFDSADGREARRAYLEKRQPKWTGK